MTHAETAADLLEAVGVEWKQRADLSRDSRPAYEIGGDNTAYFATTGGITYTGPALGTPELDAILLVAGQRVMRDYFIAGKYEAIDELLQKWKNIAFDAYPGHALASAIREIQS